MPNYSEKQPISKGKVLVDKKPSGKVVDWKNKKVKNEEYAEVLRQLAHFKKFTTVSQCAEVLTFRVTQLGHLKLYQTWFCKARLCPMCSWRKSILKSFIMKKVVTEVVIRKPTARWLFLTLTSKNTHSADELSKELTKMSKAFNAMVRRKAVKDNLLGFYRATEITVNPSDLSYNQHVHVLLCVSTSYFKKGRYLSQEKWTSLWQHHMKLDYKPVVHIARVKPNKKSKSKLASYETVLEGSGLVEAVMETSAYETKPSNFLSGNDAIDKQVIADLEKALRGKRSTSSGGIIKEIQKELKLEDAEEKSDLIHVDKDSDDDEVTSKEVVATWDKKKKNYFIE